MIGKLTSIENGPERNVELVITASELRSEISSPSGVFDPRNVAFYEVSGLQERDTGLVTLRLVLADGQRVRFYVTASKFDMVLLLDRLDGTIGYRRREVFRERVKRPFLRSLLWLLLPLCVGFSFSAAALYADVASAWGSRPSSFHIWHAQLNVLLYRAWWAAPAYFVGVEPLLAYGAALCGASALVVFGISLCLRRRLSLQHLFLVCLTLQAGLFTASLYWARILVIHYLMAHPISHY